MLLKQKCPFTVKLHAGTGFVSVLPLPLIFDLPENTTFHGETTLETSLELLDVAFNTRFEAKCRQ